MEIVLPAGAPYACEETSRTLGKLRRENIERFDPPCLLDEVVGIVPQPSDGLDPTRYYSVGHSSFPSDAASILLERIAVEKENRHRCHAAKGGVRDRRRFRIMGCATCGKGGLGTAWMSLALPGMQDMARGAAEAARRTNLPTPSPAHLLQRRATRELGECEQSGGGLMECRGCGLTAWCSEGCRLEDLRAGHHLLCRQLQAVTKVYSPEVKRLIALQRTAHWHTEDEAAELQQLQLNAYHFAFKDRPEHVRAVLKRLVQSFFSSPASSQMAQRANAGVKSNVAMVSD